jgi:hypothetical protein
MQKYKHDLKGPKPIEKWAECWRERVGCDAMPVHPAEKFAYSPMNGFISYAYDPSDGTVMVPKFCGNLRYWMKKLYRLLKEAEPLGARKLLICTRRKPVVLLKWVGGSIRSMEHSINFKTGKESTIWYMEFTLNDVNEDLFRTRL